jgi:hypothetical protein
MKKHRQPLKTFFKWLMRLVLWPLLVLVVLLITFLSLVQIFTSPSNNRDWNTDQAILPYAEQTGHLVSIHNIRNFTYASTTSYTINYYDKTFDLNKIKKVWYIVEPFADFKGAAHTFLSFEFENNNFVSISIEIRKEKGETFAATKGLLNRYEIMYVVADEKDVIKLRSNYRKDDVFVYPIKTTPDKAQALFIDMLARANKLKDSPEFYNSLTNNCTNNIAWHVNKITPNKVPSISLDYVLPAYSDVLAYKLGLIDTDLSFEQARQKYHINERAMKYADDPDFSVRIREN